MVKNLFKNTLFFFFFFLSFGYTASNSEAPPTDYISLQGFDVAHAAGYKGEGQIIAVLNDAPDINHPAFRDPAKRGKIHIFDVTRTPPPTMGKDISNFRYPEKFYDRPQMVINYVKSSLAHGNHVVGLINGKAGQYGKILFLGGAAPDCEVHSYIEGTAPLILFGLKVKGEALFSYYDLLNLYKSNHDDGLISKQMEIANKYPEFFKDRPYDDALLQAFDEISKTKAIGINASFVIKTIVHPETDLVPQEVLDRIGECLKKEDQILVLSANNQYERNLSGPSHDQIYFQQFAAHPEIGPRLLIAVNAQPDQKESVTMPAKLASQKEVSLFFSSNIPGGQYKPTKGQKILPANRLWSFAVSAYGARNLSAYGQTGASNEFYIASGTSEAAPQITSLCALIKQKYPHMTAAQIVKRVKMSATPVPPKMRPIYGWGVINAERALELGRFKK